MRVSDGAPQYLNRLIAASFISRLMLFEGTWQKYQMNNNTMAQKYLDLAVRAADIVKISGKYTFTSDFRSLFGSEDLTANKEVIMYRVYDAALRSYTPYCFIFKHNRKPGTCSKPRSCKIIFVQ